MAQSLQAGTGQLFPASWAPPQRQLQPDPPVAGPVPAPEGGLRPLLSGCLFGLSVSRALGLCNRPARHFCERSRPAGSLPPSSAQRPPEGPALRPAPRGKPRHKPAPWPRRDPVPRCCRCCCCWGLCCWPGRAGPSGRRATRSSTGSTWTIPAPAPRTPGATATSSWRSAS